MCVSCIDIEKYSSNIALFTTESADKSSPLKALLAVKLFDENTVRKHEWGTWQPDLIVAEWYIAFEGSMGKVLAPCHLFPAIWGQ